VNGTFLSPPARPARTAPAPHISPEEVQLAWRKLDRSQRQAFIRTVGVRESVRLYGLSVLEVALCGSGCFEDNLRKTLEAVA
jgi:hypothetical protein